MKTFLVLRKLCMEVLIGNEWHTKHDICSKNFKPSGKLIQEVSGYFPTVLANMFNRDPKSLHIIFEHNYFRYYLCKKENTGETYFVDEWILTNIPTLLIGFRFESSLVFDRATIIELIEKKMIVCKTIFSPTINELGESVPGVISYMTLRDAISSLIRTNIYDDTDY